MNFDRNRWAAAMVLADCPREYFEPLLALDGVTSSTAIQGASIPASMYGFHLVTGSADSGFGAAWSWPTDFGQAVIDMLKGRISSKFPYDPLK